MTSLWPMRPRRGLIVATLAVWLLGPACSAPSAVGPARVTASQRSIVNAPFDIAAVGDIILVKSALPQMERRSPDMLRILRDADVAFGNFESAALDLRSFAGSPQAQSGGTWLRALPTVPGELRRMGFDLLSLANNHANDWGVEGLSETIRRLDRAGLAHAGAGMSLSRARAPRSLRRGGREVALLAAASTFPAGARAADGFGAIPGRPGLNPIRVERTVMLPPGQLEALREVAAAVPAAPSDRLNEADCVKLLGVRYCATERPSPWFSYAMHAGDLAENLDALRRLRLAGSLALYSVHSHEPYNAADEPADFLVVLARQAIDNGADMVVGHGPHRLRGIEIYRGRPIFYSLGNFAMTTTALDELPREMYEEAGIEPGSVPPAQILARRESQAFSDPAYFQSVIAVGRFEGSELRQVRLYPIELDRAAGAVHGLPTLARGEAARLILERLQRLSAPFGTHIAIERGIGVIDVFGREPRRAAAPRYRTPSSRPSA